MDLSEFSHHPLVEGLGDDDLKTLAECLVDRDYAPSEKLLDEGTTPDGLVLLSKGVVEVQKQTEHGRPHTITTLSAQTVLGEIEFLSGSRASASVVAKTDSSTSLLPREVFRDWLTLSHPCASRIAYNIGRVLALRLEETNLALVRLIKPEEVREFEAFRKKLVSEWNF